MGKNAKKIMALATIISATALTDCATTNATILPQKVPSLYGPTASDMPSHAGANEERCSAIFSEINDLTTRLNLPPVDEDKGILKPAKFNRGEIRRAYLMGLARGIPCPKTSLESTMSWPSSGAMPSG